jgi:hypothetical protein
MYTKKFAKNQHEKTKKTVYLVKKGENHKVVRQILKNVQKIIKIIKKLWAIFNLECSVVKW